ncbi:MAG: hypothetical protein WC457_02825 [Patescibacteria group bacterium]
MAEAVARELKHVAKPGANVQLTSFHLAFGVVDGSEAEKIWEIVRRARDKYEEMSRRLAEMAAKGLADPRLIR